MIHTPPHKQTDPNKAPGQQVNHVQDNTLSDYIHRKYRDEAFNNVKAEKPKLTFDEWLRQSSFVEPDAGTTIWLQDCWNAAQENCR